MSELNKIIIWISGLEIIKQKYICSYDFNLFVPHKQKRLNNKKDHKPKNQLYLTRKWQQDTLRNKGEKLL